MFQEDTEQWLIKKTLFDSIDEWRHYTIYCKCVLTDEWISKNPGWSETSEIEWEGSEEALTVSGINDVVDWLNGVNVGSNGDVKGSWGRGAINEVDLIEVIISCSGGLGETSNNSLWSSEERGSGVRDNIDGLGVRGSSVLKPDGEEWLIENSLIDGVDEWWDNSVDGEGGEGKSENSVGGVILEVSGDLAGDTEGGGWDGQLRLSLGSEL
ncbi:hypothetical protein GCK72_018802 [Caenorhabditis remanei]|uniref:Uncharacterized protein n=1 Tax=Caenorhabditis remanei TaxID=31234 RepID=A0A6A5GAV1_CAERE|nr:hypothetical protein GCK72_018802 [Caenorhabditis remanei]KAF1752248.1 hypothetical protein GCK72_018802 [Caenorhabditis remanei]